MNRTKSAYIAGTVSIFTNIALFAVKMWAGIVSNSIALTADAWHTLSDSLSSVIVILGVKLSSKKADKAHPFGHGRWEQIAAIFIGFMLGIIAYDFLKDSIIQFKSKEAANFGLLAIVVTILSIVVKEALAQYSFYIARKTGNLSLKADGWHHRTDALSSVIVLIGIFFTDRFWWVDSVLGVVISFMLFYAAYEITKDAINKLLGEKPSPELIKKVEAIIQSLYDKEFYPHHFHIHNYVTSQELTFHIKVEGTMDINAAHKVATDIEYKINKDLNIMSTVHIEPKNFEHEFD